MFENFSGLVVIAIVHERRNTRFARTATLHSDKAMTRGDVLNKRDVRLRHAERLIQSSRLAHEGARHRAISLAGEEINTIVHQEFKLVDTLAAGAVTGTARKTLDIGHTKRSHGRPCTAVDSAVQILRQRHRPLRGHAPEYTFRTSIWAARARRQA